MKDFILIGHFITLQIRSIICLKFDMSLYDIEIIDIHGGSLRLYIKFIYKNDTKVVENSKKKTYN